MAIAVSAFARSIAINCLNRRAMPDRLRHEDNESASHAARQSETGRIRPLARHLDTALLASLISIVASTRGSASRCESTPSRIAVPLLIATEDFEAVQARLVDRRPTVRAARVTTTNNLLVGIAFCGCGGDGCNGRMTTSTGKNGQYKYYACSNRAISCRAGSIIRTRPMNPGARNYDSFGRERHLLAPGWNDCLILLPKAILPLPIRASPRSMPTRKRGSLK